MKKNIIQHCFVIALSFFTLLIFSGTALALSTMTTSSSLNWEGLSFIANEMDVTETVLWDNHEYTNLGAYAEDDIAVANFNSDGTRIIDHGPWRALELSAVVDNAFGSASTTVEQLSVQASASANGIATIDAEANADLHRTGDFKLDGTGSFTLQLTVPYTMLIESFGDNNWSYSLIELTLSKTTYVDGDGTTVEYGYDSVLDFSDSGLLSIYTDLEFGVFYGLNAHLYSAVTATEHDPVPDPVPEPSTVLLFGSGLAGLAFYRRKRNKC